MKAIKCEVHEPCADYTRISYYSSIRQAVRYCRRNGIPKHCIYTRDGIMVFGNGYSSINVEE